MIFNFRFCLQCVKHFQHKISRSLPGFIDMGCKTVYTWPLSVYPGFSSHDIRERPYFHAVSFFHGRWMGQSLYMFCSEKVTFIGSRQFWILKDKVTVGSEQINSANFWKFPSWHQIDTQLLTPWDFFFTIQSISTLIYITGQRSSSPSC